MSDPARLLQAFDRQVGWCAQSSPFSARVLERSRDWLAAHDAALGTVAAVADDPLVGAVALRWLAGLHHLALLGLQPWAGLWSSFGTPPDDLLLDAAIDSAWRDQRAHMQASLSGPPQTNEVQRSTALLPGLLHVAALTGRPLALAEIGSSAGLNLWCDRYRYRFQAVEPSQAWAWGGPAATPVLDCEWSGGRPSNAEKATLAIVQRAGCDAAPVDLQQPGQDIRLASFIWADQPERLARLRSAVAVARECMARQGVQVERAQAADFVRRQLERRPEGAAWVLMHSVVWQYIDAGEQADIRARMKAAGAAATATAPLAWLRFEPPRADLRVELRCRVWPGEQDTLLAVCHPHGTWVQWQPAT